MIKYQIKSPLRQELIDAGVLIPEGDTLKRHFVPQLRMTAADQRLAARDATGRHERYSLDAAIADLNDGIRPDGQHPLDLCYVPGS